MTPKTMRLSWAGALRNLWASRVADPLPPRPWLTRIAFFRLFGFLYLIAFLVVVNQWSPLLGERGLYPVPLFLERVGQSLGTARFFRVPTLFWLGYSDGAAMLLGWLGVGLSVVAMSRWACAPVFAALWALYQSFLQVGQLFYGYGWETMLLETGFLAIFFAPLRPGRLLSREAPPPPQVVWLLRWLTFRVMFGAGLIKLRGDPCWRDLTCLLTHYETQPMPNPLSWYFHHLPVWMNKAGVLFNHFVELAVPWFLFGPRRLRLAAGGLTVLFQAVLILSGNLSFLNWLTIAAALACFDDGAWRFLFGSAARAAVPREEVPLSRGRTVLCRTLTALVGVLSLFPVMNMLSPGQAMNASFEPFHLVNTYGAFGSVGKERYEIVLEGTNDAVPDEAARWREYEFKGKPGDPRRRPPVVAPYHLRLDWQIWFAAMSDYQRNPWLVHFVYKLLRNDPGALGLLAGNPFPDAPPRYVRATFHRYGFTESLADGVWERRRAGMYLPPLSADDPSLRAYLKNYGWEE